VFTSAVGTPLDCSNVGRYFRRILKRAELPRIRFHDLRHSCASLLLAQGMHPRVVMEILGHRPIALTLNTYSHVFPSLHKEAAASIDVLLASQG
jgi:integrase